MSSFLLDTNILIFLLTSPTRVPKKLRDSFLLSSNQLYVSQVSLLEIGFKVSSSKLVFPIEDFDKSLEVLNATFLPITVDHVLKMIELPNHHRDPYDRLLIAQAEILGIVVVTSEPMIKKYKANTIII